MDETGRYSMHQIALKLMEEKCESYPAMFITYSSDDNSTLALNQTTIDNIINPAYAGWLTEPDRDIEAEWDAYVDSVYANGLTENLQIRQAAYEKYMEQLK